MSGVRTILLKELCNFEKGSTGLMKAIPGQYPLVTTGAERRTCESYQFDTKAVCIPLVSSTGHGHASLNNVHYQEGKFALGTILVALTAKSEDEVDMHFLHLYLSQLKDVVLVPLMKGAANVSLSITAIKGVEVPLPPIERQIEIVNKFKSIVEEEQALIDELDSQKHLISLLRESILRDAVSGNLTQNWRDNLTDIRPVSELLDKIKKKKELLIENKVVKKGKKQASADLGDIYIDLPSTWEYVDLDDITQYITDGTHQTPRYTDTGRLFLSAQNVKPFRFMPENHKYVSEEDFQGYIKNRKPEKGDLLVGRVGSKGETAVIDQELDFAIYVSLGLVKTFKELSSPEYLAIVMNSPYGKAYATGNMSSTGASAGNYNLGRIRSFPVPFPPLNEQYQIVEKVADLFLLCKQIEKQISDNLINAKELMHIVLKEEFDTNK